jgi:hypothetical protein
MESSGASAASLMHRLRTRRRLPLFVLLVLAFQVLAPVWHAAVAGAEPLTTVLCTAEGVRHVVVAGSDTPAQALAQHTDCPYCGAHWQPTLSAAADPLWVTPPCADETLLAASPPPLDAQRVVAAHRTRAPPPANCIALPG